MNLDIDKEESYILCFQIVARHKSKENLVSIYKLSSQNRRE